MSSLSCKFEKFYPDRILEAKPPVFKNGNLSSEAEFHKARVDINDFFVRVLCDMFMKKGLRITLEDFNGAVDYVRRCNPGLVPGFLDTVASQTTMVDHAMAVAKYHLNKGKVYVVQKDFYDKFSKVDLSNMEYQHLPQEDTYGYVVLPKEVVSPGMRPLNEFIFTYGNPREHLTDISHFFRAYLQFVNPNDDASELTGSNLDNLLDEYENELTYPSKDKVVYMNIRDLDDGFSVMPMALPKDSTMKVMDSLKLKSMTTGGEPTKKQLSKEAIKQTMTLVNILAYINSGQPDIRSFRNSVRYKGNSKKVVRSDKNLHMGPIELVGYNYKKPSISHTDSWGSSEHFGWRRCGVGRKDIKLVFVKGCTKTRKSSNFIKAA